uniref:Uncharacterized protein n=1 Tax=Xiphophorus couchianus TaxID=32473 RepID=A0A3B5LC61_9TELE
MCKGSRNTHLRTVARAVMKMKIPVIFQYYSGSKHTSKSIGEVKGKLERVPIRLHSHSGMLIQSYQRRLNAEVESKYASTKS